MSYLINKIKISLTFLMIGHMTASYIVIKLVKFKKLMSDGIGAKCWTRMKQNDLS